MTSPARTASRRLLVLLGIVALVAATSGCIFIDDDDGFVQFSNDTSDFVDVYINGHYRATLGPFGDAIYRVDEGYHDLYADSVPGDWGPITVFIEEDTTFVYELDP